VPAFCGAALVKLSLLSQFAQVTFAGKATAWMRTAESGNALTFHFCPTCGSPPRLYRTTLAAGK
jgi:hypothetical protein